MKLKLLLPGLLSLVLVACTGVTPKTPSTPTPSPKPVSQFDTKVPTTPEPVIDQKEVITKDLVKQFAAKYKKSAADVEVTVGKIETHAAEGSISFAEKQGGAKWFAAREKGGWILVHDGQGPAKCADIEPKDFSKTLMPECLSDKGKLIKR